MKAKLTLFLFVLFTLQLNSPSILDNGASWYYTTITFWTPGFDFNKVSIVGDSIIQQKECKVLNRTKITCDGRWDTDYIFSRKIIKE